MLTAFQLENDGSILNIYILAMRMFLRWQTSMIEKIIYTVAGWALSAVSTVDLYGWENIPQKGSFILASNHLGIQDGPLGLVLLFKRGMNKPIVTIAEKYQQYAVYRWLVKKLDYLFVDRYNADFLTIRKVYR